MINEKKRKSGIIITVLVVLLIVAAGYIGYVEISTRQVQKYESFYQLGVEQAIVTIAQQASACQQVPLTVGNQTINLVAMECLQQGEQ